MKGEVEYHQNQYPKPILREREMGLEKKQNTGRLTKESTIKPACDTYVDSFLVFSWVQLQIITKASQKLGEYDSYQSASKPIWNEGIIKN